MRRNKKKAALRKAEIAAGGLFVVLAVVLLAMSCRDRREDATAKAEDAAAQPEKEAEEEDFITYQGKKYKYNKDIETCLCMGIDKSLPIEEKVEGVSEGLSDANMLVCANKETGEIKILAIPRDTMVTVKVVDSSGEFRQTARQQLTLQYAYGNSARESCKLMAETVSNLLYQVPVDRYCSINMDVLPIINDAVGGVDVTALEDVTLSGGTVHAGEPVHLEGNDALTYVRTRDVNELNSSLDRLARQSQYIAAYLEKASRAMQQDPSLAAGIFESLDDNMYANITADDLGDLASAAAGSGMGDGDILTVPGEMVMGEKLAEYYVDEAGLKELVIQTFFIEIPEEKD